MSSEVIRYALLFVTWLCIFQIAGFLYYYSKVMLPLRQQLGEKVLAPPFRWTFAYHAVVGVIEVLLAWGTFIRLQQNADIPPPTVALVFANGCLAVVVNRFYVHYREILHRAANEA